MLINAARTLEMLDQLDLYDEMAQTEPMGRRNVPFKDGKRVQGRGVGTGWRTLGAHILTFA